MIKLYTNISASSMLLKIKKFSCWMMFVSIMLFMGSCNLDSKVTVKSNIDEGVVTVAVDENSLKGSGKDSRDYPNATYPYSTAHTEASEWEVGYWYTQGTQETNLATRAQHTYNIKASLASGYTDQKSAPNATSWNYYWNGWTGVDDNNAQNTDTQSDKEVAITVVGAEDPVTAWTYTANWLCPEVTAVSPTSITKKTIYHPTNAWTTDFTFTVKEAVSKDNFTLSSYNVTAEAGDVSGESLVVTTSYTPQNKHNVAISEIIAPQANVTYSANKTFTTDPSAGSVTLTSKFKGTETNPTSVTANINIVEDYVPRYTMPITYDKDNQMGVVTITDLRPNIKHVQEEGKDAVDNYAAQTGKWSYSITNTEHFGYTGSTYNDLTITVDPKGLNVNSSTPLVLEAVLTATCTYTDANKCELTTTTTTQITIAFKSLTNPILELVDPTSGAIVSELDLGDAVYPTEGEGKVILNQYNVSNLDWEWDANLFTNELNGNEVTITSLPKKAPIIGAKQDRLVVTATGKDQDGNESQLTCSLIVKINMILATPELTVAMTDDKTAKLTWTKVEGATGYAVYCKQGVYDSPDDFADGDKQVEVLSSVNEYTISDRTAAGYSYMVIALWGSKPNYNQPSNVVYKSTITSPSFIDYDNADNTGLYTGTKSNPGTFPYRQLREVVVTSAFNSDHEPIFDSLYIFGQTINTNSGHDNIGYTTAMTPCYIYYRDVANKRYVLRDGNTGNKDPDPTISNVNVANKNTEYFQLNASNQSLYFTGWCPYATTGTTLAENGVLYITSNGLSTVNIYIDNLQLYAREKKDKDTFTYTLEDSNTALGILGAGSIAIQGSGSAFVFNSTGNNAFKPNIHIMGENEICGAMGVTFKINVTDQAKIDGTYTQPNAAIQVLANNANQKTELTIDDIWADGSHTYGELELKETPHRAGTRAPLIDLGNANTKLTIGGGLITFENANTDLAMSYRKLVRNRAGKELTIFGTCDVTNSKDTHTGNGVVLDDASAALNIVDGTFSCTKESKILTLPQTTTINGGSYNCILTKKVSEGTTAIFENSYGATLGRFDVDMLSDYGTVVDGMANITNFAKLTDDLFARGAGFIDNANNARMLSQYYSSNRKYGYECLAVDAEKLYLMLPTYGSANIPWQICAPHFLTTMNGNPVVAGGGIPQMPTNVQRLLYMEIDDFTHNASAGYVSPYGVAMSLNEAEPNHEVITEDNNYTISGVTYMLKPIVADNWMLFAAPFDVKSVYVIEAYPEKQLKKDFGAVRGKIPAENVLPARRAQAQRLLDLYAYWYTDAVTAGTSSDFFGAEANTYGKFVNDWITYETAKKVDESAAAAAYTPSIELLQHYTGNNANSAHYYLYKAKDNWTYDAKNSKFTAAEGGWEVVNTSGNIMEKGQVYAMQFPHNVIGGVHDPVRTWDYWTGKYLLLVSDGTEEIASDYSLPSEQPANGYANLYGNSSFNEAQLTPTNLNANVSMWGGLHKINAGTTGNNTERDIHEFLEMKDDVVSLAPAEGFILANIPAPSNMRARSINYRTGVVTYEKIADEDIDDDDNPGLGSGIPTIMNGMTLIVEPTEQGLTITPIKEQHVMLFDANGKMIFSKHLSAEENVTLPTGVYVVRGEYEQVKAIKK